MSGVRVPDDARAAPVAPAALGLAAVLAMFGAFAAAYFMSALLRAVTATLAPVFSVELGLKAADLGLLAGAYFLGFAAMQLPLGRSLDRFGPRRTLLALLTLAVLGCVAFALAGGLPSLVVARMLIGVGVSACLMAPLTCYRRWLSPAAQLRTNSWMLMTGSLGMVASTLPVQWLLPALGWRGVFWLCAGLLALAMALVATLVPRDERRRGALTQAEPGGGYRQIVRHPLFVRTAPVGFFIYGGMIAVQALWAGPWMTRVGGLDAQAAATGLFAINVAMLFTFMAWGALMPRLAARGIDAMRLMRFGLPLCLAMLAANLLLGPGALAWHWAAWCVACTFVTVSQPAVGAAFPAARAGRALSAFNLVIFAGVFSIQWGIGLVVDAALAFGASETGAFRLAFAVFGACSLAAYLWLLRGPSTVVADNAPVLREPT